MQAAPANPGDQGRAVPLSGIIGAVDGTPYANDRDVAEYYGTLNSSMIMRGNVDSSAKSITFKVGVHNPRGNIPRPNPLHRIDTSMATSEEIMKACEEMGRRNEAMPVTWERMDLFGVVRRLSMGAAYYSTWGVLSSAELRGGGNVNIAALAAAIEPIAADNGTVYVSTKMVSPSRPNVIAALANAISGEGGTMVTGLLGIGQNGVVQVPNAQNAGLAQGCHEALRLLETLFSACGQGAFYALAVTEGVHRIKSVHGHTDEGAYPRTVMRRLEAGVPFGALPLDLVAGNSLPNPQRSVAGFRAVYDGVGLATAGGTALADPMISHEGRVFPTVLTSDQGAFCDPGDNNAGDAQDSADITTQWAEAAGEWAKNFATVLNRIFNLQGGETLVMRHLTAQANSLAGTDERHMNVKAAVAFFWIEPSCSCPVGGAEFPAYAANHGPLATGQAERTVPALDGVAILEDRSDHMRVTVQVDFRYLRRHGLFVHLTQHQLNGTGDIDLESGVVNDFALVGGAGALGPRILAGNALNTFTWGRGDSCVPSGGELICLSKSLVFTVRTTRRPVRGVVRNTHTPRRDELISGDVVYSVSRLVGTAPAPARAVPVRDIRRARTRAATALVAAGDSGRSGYVINEQLMRPSLVDYGAIPPGRTGVVRPPSGTEQVPPDPGAVDAAAPIIPDVDIGPRVGHAAHGASVNGPMAPVHIENRRDRGPRVPRAGRVGAGGVPPAPPGGGGPQGGLPPVAAPGGGQPPQPPGGGGGGQPPPPHGGGGSGSSMPPPPAVSFSSGNMPAGGGIAGSGAAGLGASPPPAPSDSG